MEEEASSLLLSYPKGIPPAALRLGNRENRLLTWNYNLRLSSSLKVRFLPFRKSTDHGPIPP
jgi:hypothetical protein